MAGRVGGIFLISEALAMLKFLSGRKRSRNALLILFIIILTASLVGLFSVVVSGGGAGLFGGAGGSDTTIAKVGSYAVTLKEFKDQVARFSQQINQGQGKAGAQDFATTYGMYGPQILDSLIGEKLVLYEADHLNLTASDAEVEQRLKQYFNPMPPPDQYRAQLQSRGYTPTSFEDSLRAFIAREHLRSYLTAAVQVSPKEVEADYQRTNNKYAARWVEVTADSLKDKVVVNDTDLRAYFDSHKDDFKITTEQRRARYIFVDQTKAGEVMQVSDDELKPLFDPERNVQQVRVSQIVLNLPKLETDSKSTASRSTTPDTKAQDQEDEVRKKAQSLADRARGTAGNPEDFAKLAREASDDAKTKANGGDLGWIKKADKRAPDDPLNNAFNMKPGDVSQPIKKGDQYYIIKVTDKKQATFEEAKPQLLKTARANKGYTEAVNIATNEVEPKFKETKNAEAVVAEVNQKHGAQVASIKELPFFSEGEALPEISAAPELDTSVFGLENPGDVGQHVNVPGGFAVVQYLEKRDPHDPTFEEVKAKVEQRYRADKSKDLALERARQIAQAKTPDEMKNLATSFGLKTDERAGLSEGDSIGPLNTEESREPAYKLKAGEVGHEPLKTDSGNSYVVVAFTGRQDADMGEAFTKEKKSIEQKLLEEKRNTYFNTYLKLLQKQLQDDGTIKIYKNRIDSASEANSSQPGAVPQQPGIPGGMPQPSRTGPRRTPQGGIRPQ